MIKIIGWTGIYHSYAMVNQWQLLSLEKAGRQIIFEEAPKNPNWSVNNSPAGFPDPLKKKLEEIKTRKSQGDIKAEYRISYPFDLSTNPKHDVFVFGTAEYGRYPHAGNSRKDEFMSKLNSSEFKLITPSLWSKNGFIRSGADESHIDVISHGVDTSIFKPFIKNDKENFRQQMGISKDDFVISNFGAMTVNKGVDLLLTAAWILIDKIPNLKILLKDAKSLYNFSLKNFLVTIPEATRNKIIKALNGKIILYSNALSVYDMSVLYNVSNCYVSPYRAEGFNLPPLEASSCGIPIIVTKGGSTDDYFENCMGSQIESEIEPSTTDEGMSLSPDIDSLVEAILQAYYNKENFSHKNSTAMINKNYTWDKISRDLLSVIDPN